MGRIGQLKRTSARLIGGIQNMTMSRMVCVTCSIGFVSKYTEFRILVWWCQLWECCCPTSGLVGHGNIVLQNLLFPLHALAKMQCRAFSLVEPSTWNLSSDLHVILTRESAYTTYKHMKTIPYCRSWLGAPPSRYLLGGALNKSSE